MEMEEKHNTNSHESWSELPQDLLISILEHLRFIDFHRCKLVCTSWLSASRHSSSKKHIHHHPWLILFPKEDDNENNTCTLFNPEEKHKLYKTHDLGFEFTKSVCIATFGSWLLMRDPRRNLYIVNPFNRNEARIDLPPFESQRGRITIERTQDGKLHNTSSIRGIYRGIFSRFHVFWIDDKTKDYFVIWSLSELCVVYTKNGDSFWNQIPKTSKCCHMVFNNYKLYLLSLHLNGCFNIFDFSRGIPQLLFRCGVIVETHRTARRVRPWKDPMLLIGTKIVVTVTGRVLTVAIWLRQETRAWSFRIRNVCSSEFRMIRGLVTSLGDEAMFLDQGVTVLANESQGFIRNCIYFTDIHDENTHDILRFNLETQKLDRLHTFDSSSIQFSRALWFSPR